MRVRLVQRARAARRSESNGQRRAERAGERAQDRPVLARIARREGGAVAELHAALGVDPGAGFFGVGGAGQDDVGAVRAGIAMRAEIDDEARPAAACRSRRRRAGRARRARPLDGGDHVARRKPALARHEADVERRRRAKRRCAARRGRSSPRATAPTSAASRAAAESTAAPFGPVQRALPDDDQRPLGGLQRARRTRPRRRSGATAIPGRRRDSRRRR